MRYITDGTALWEVLWEQSVKNAGLTGGTLRYLTVMDCRTDEMTTMTVADLSDCRQFDTGEAA